MSKAHTDTSVVLSTLDGSKSVTLRRDISGRLWLPIDPKGNDERLRTLYEILFEHAGSACFDGAPVFIVSGSVAACAQTPALMQVELRIQPVASVQPVTPSGAPNTST